VLICGSLLMSLSVGTRQVSGIFLRPVTVDIGMTTAAFGTAVALQNVVWGFSQPFAGFLADRYGARIVATLGGVIYASGLCLAAWASTSLVFTFGYGFLCGLGQAGTAYAVILAVISRASPADRRSQVMAWASAAGSIGMFILVPFSTAMIDVAGWRSAMIVLGVLLAAAPFLSVALDEPPQTSTVVHGGLRTLVSASKDRDFWLMNFGFAACGFQLAFLATYLPTILVDAGQSIAVGAAVLATIGAANIVGTLGTGWAGGRWLKSRILVCVYLARALIMAAFFLIPISTFSALAFGLAFGLLWTATVPLTSALVGHVWGSRNLGFLFGTVYVGHQIGAFLGAGIGGFSYQRTGSFASMWAIAIGLSLISAVCHFLLVERPRPSALAEGAA
jgi:predicted MFS family arabinose efflux permease